MTDPAQYRPAPGEIPDSPGVYRFRDPHGRVVYVGKAKNLRARLSSYFQDLSALHPRTQQMVTTASSVEWTVVATEVESLQLEYSWIKEFDPRFNVKYRDDKSYPYLAITMGEEFPRVQVMRGAKRKGTRYFGPYTHAWAIRETVDLLLRVFPVRTCSTGVFKRAAQVGRPCLLGYIDRCSAPCTGAISAPDHRALAEDLADFMAGHTGRFVARVEAEMRAASEDLDFERAARLRDDLGALTTALEKSAVVLPDATDADVFALADDELEAAVQVFHVRGGRVRGQRGWVVEKTEDVSAPDLVQQLLLQVYGDTTAETPGEEGTTGTSSSVPREVLVPTEPTDLAQTTAWLTGLRGSAVDVRVPRRGDKRALAETVHRNAEGALKLHKSRRGGDLTTRGQALAQIQEALGLAEVPLRVECYDVSHLQGTEVVASMVVFEDGLPRKAEYRRFAVRGLSAADAAATGREVGATDDVSAMHEVITRRFRRQARDEAAAAGLGVLDPETGELTEAPAGPSASSAPMSGEVGVAAGIDPDTGRPRRFAYAPNLVVVDGAGPQVAAAVAAMEALGITDVAVCGLAKRLEEVWVPGEEFPVVLPRTSQGLYLLQRVRDEAHRFAITYHRSKRSRSMTVSALDGVAGLGPARRTALMKRFGSLKRLRAATAEELQEVSGIGASTAATIVAALAAGSGGDGAGGADGGHGGDGAGGTTAGEAAAGGAGASHDDPLPAVNPTTGELVDS